jgi:hypothetical protein
MHVTVWIVWCPKFGAIMAAHTDCDTVQSGTQYQCFVETNCPHLQVQRVTQNLSRAIGSLWVHTQPHSCSFLSYIVSLSFPLSYSEHGGSQFLQNVRNVSHIRNVQHNSTASHPEGCTFSVNFVQLCKYLQYSTVVCVLLHISNTYTHIITQTIFMFSAPYGIFARSCVAMAKDSKSTFQIIDDEG